MTQWVGLIDCNNFFVSCERLFRPDLKGKPVLVLSSNDGCVIARSQEIKDMGVPMGVPYFQIKDIIKDTEITTFSTHFALYRDISRRVFNIVKRELQNVSVYSVDEAFFAIEGSAEEVTKQLRIVRDKIEKETGIPVSIGVSLSKTLAKYASKQAKKTGGLHVVSLATWKELNQSVTLESLWGVGGKTAAAFREKGLHTVADFLHLEERQIRALFGITGVRLWYELQGVPAITTVSRGEGDQGQKSILHSRSFKTTTTDISVLHDAVAYHVREAAKDLRGLGMVAGSFQVYLGTSRHGDFFLKGGSKQVFLTPSTADSFLLLKEAKRLTEELFEAGVPYKKAGVLLTDFTPEQYRSSSLFQEEKTTKTEALTKAIDVINRSLTGGTKVLLGSHLKQSVWESASLNKSPAYTTNWKDIKIVKA